MSKKYSTKADTLSFLREIMGKKKVVVDKLFVFTVQNWKSNSALVLETIGATYTKNTSLVIRSSAMDEDDPQDSKAGFYSSVLDINSSDQNKLIEAIECVILSYSKNNRTANLADQVIIQSQLTESVFSGVVFTYDTRLNSPYYVINFDNTFGKTDTVTKGLSKQALRVARWVAPETVGYPWGEVLSAVKEIEMQFPLLPLDIEFGIEKSGVLHIFQSRLLTSRDNIRTKSIDISDEIVLKDEVQKLKQQVIKYLSEGRDSYKTKTILTDMSDWNPAEILGGRPNHLDTSLYRYLVTKSSWNTARVSMGYTDTAPKELMVCIGDKPYIDTKVSFESLTPSTLQFDTRNRLVEHYLNKLSDKPHLQDKIEFEIVLSCYDFNFENRKTELLKSGLTARDAESIEREIRFLTNHILDNSEQLIRSEMQKAEILSKENMLFTNPENVRETVNGIFLSLNLCREYGVIPFAKLARLAFIGMSFLKSMVSESMISQEFADSFLDGINSVTKTFVYDFNKLLSGQISQKDFIHQYGHLRPGTYNILALRYADLKDLFLFTPRDNWNPNHISRGGIYNTKVLSALENSYKKNQFNYSPIFIFHFIEDAIKARELSKFYFTRVLSNSLEAVANVGETIGLSRGELAYITIDDLKILQDSEISINYAKDLLIEKILLNVKQKSILTKIPMPPVITKDQDLEIITYYEATPNFITRKKVQGEVVLLNKLNQSWVIDLSNKIVLIENADPGFDWIFTSHPKALLTKYGGVGSHMAIRCAELTIPAAIGCGEIIFEQCSRAKIIILDCDTEFISPL